MEGTVAMRVKWRRWRWAWLSDGVEEGTDEEDDEEVDGWDDTGARSWGC